MKYFKQLVTLFKNNLFFRIAVIVGTILLALTVLLAPKKSSQTISAPSSNIHSTETFNRPELQGLSEEKLRQASDYRSIISDRLPIRVDEFNTSVGITTSINIFFLPDDPSSVIRFEIYGLSYLNKDSTPLTNPNIIAFQETFSEGLKLMKNVGIDPKQVILIYGDTEYVRLTASAWVDKLGLLK